MGATFIRLPLLLLSALTCACAIPVELEGGSISYEAETPHQSPSGRSYRVSVYLDRPSIARVVLHQLYANILIIDCETLELEHAVFPYLNGAASDNFEDMQRFLDQNSSSILELSGSFNSSLDFEQRPYCLTLDGGSYLLRKIESPVIRASIETSLSH